MQRDSNGEDEREDFKAVEGPAEVRGDERFPLRAVERAIPRRRREDGGFAHDVLLEICASTGRSRLKSLRQHLVLSKGGAWTMFSCDGCSAASDPSPREAGRGWC